MRKSRPLSPEIAQELADELANILNKSNALAVEKVYAVSSLLRGIGEAMYDREDVTYNAVLADYTASPTWPAALILISHLPHEIRELLIRERDTPEANVKLWKEFEEKLNGDSTKDG